MGGKLLSRIFGKKNFTITEEMLAIKIIGDPRNFTGFNNIIYGTS
jgi:hypothetical protein